jgi:hypothetical protein
MVAERLLRGSPRIATGRVYGIDEPGLVVSVINLQAGQEKIVGDRIAQIFAEAANNPSK